MDELNPKKMVKAFQSHMQKRHDESPLSRNPVRVQKDLSPGLEVAYPSPTLPSKPDTSSPKGPSSKVWTESKEIDWDNLSDRRRIVGLRPPIFWTLIVALVLVFTAGIAGGIGGGLAAQRKAASSSATSPTPSQNPSPTGTTTQQSGVPSPAATDGCPGIDLTLYTPLDAMGNAIPVDPTNTSLLVQDFRLFCNTNWPTGASSGNPDIHDILKVYAPDLTTCISLCAEYNEQYQTSLNNGIDVGGGFCKVATIIKQEGEFCYLRNGTGATNTTFGTPSDYTSGVLFAPGQIAGLSS